MVTPEGAELDVDVVENEDGTFDIFYTAPQPGEYVICVRFGGEHIPNSPFQVTVSDVQFNLYSSRILLHSKNRQWSGMAGVSDDYKLFNQAAAGNDRAALSYKIPKMSVLSIRGTVVESMGIQNDKFSLMNHQPWGS